MNRTRDLLVMYKNQLMSEELFEAEVMRLHNLLENTESLDNFSLCNEVIDCNKRKISARRANIVDYIKFGFRKPFIFLNTLN